MTDAERERHRLANAEWRKKHPSYRPQKVAARVEARRQILRDAWKAPTKLCQRCKLVKSRATDFHKRTKAKDGLQSYCKGCNCEAVTTSVRKINQTARDKRVPVSASSAHTSDHVA
jgi:rRNA-processing protein FCF1